MSLESRPKDKRVVVKRESGGFTMAVGWLHGVSPESLCLNQGSVCATQPICRFDQNALTDIEAWEMSDGNHLTVQVKGEFFKEVLSPQLKVCEELDLYCVSCGEKLHYNPFLAG
ncbi:hypothetical protein A2975_02100 [Candidatus Woesebacteria bacterium RIFCSPLOWO2_01_FULL_44_14]|uniref:Uncharacterized protein n=1 Tax=Candidatus Woesebacteria bacterium RIFCSPLOWO2_01_FULL_44_14 TaxID=1802525 RepID=A0A1F8BXX6_9BACT|nr:MAG: hypothetical protein A2975_02100 [Candidatus Woesebacteria bacterium RIFCSPLOWO2_01_FULL_44_14]